MLRGKYVSEEAFHKAFLWEAPELCLGIIIMFYISMNLALSVEAFCK